MKLNKLFITFFILISPFSILHSQITIKGSAYAVDTLEYYQAGPGVMYTKFRISNGSRVRTLYVLETDMTNPYNKIEEWQSQKQVGTFQLLTDAHQAMDAPNHHPIGSVNCNFWVGTPNIEVDPSLAGCDGQCLSGTARNGWLVGEPMYNWNRWYPGDDHKQSVGFVMITKEKRAFIEDMWYDGYVRINGQRHALRDCNRTRTNPNTDEIALFNEYIGNRPTRTTDGVEIVFTPHEWNINEDMHCTVISKNSTGGTTLQPNQGVLQGRGTGKTFLSTLQPGDTFAINLDIFSLSDTIRPHITQMMTGNALVMKNGQLMPRNTTEDYCNKDYPRSMFGTNDSGDRFWMMIVENPGMRTDELCDILKFMGATNAAGADGGGSAQMNLFGKIQNPTTENSPRRLPNSFFVVSTAPDSDIPGQLQFVKPLYSIPAYASYTPTLRAWTAEGLLLSHDYKGYTLSCEPASLGTISADGLTFTANPVTESGKLIATAGTGRAETPIEIRNGEVHIVLDSVILGNRDYKVDVQAIAGDLALPLDAKALTWLSMDENRCTVNDEGILHAMANGRTQVVGSLAEFSDTLLVITEMASNSQLSFLNSPLSIDTAFSNTRTAAGVLPINVRLWGNPDSILIVVNSDAPVQAMELTYRPNDGESDATNISGKTTVNEDYTYTFATDQLMDVADQGIYPILLESAKFTLKDPKKSKSYRFTIKDIILCYRDWAEVTALPTQLAKPAKPVKLMVNGQVYIIKNNHIYDVHGHEMK